LADIQQNPANEEARENKKQVHTRPTYREESLEQRRRRLTGGNTNVVVKKNQQNGYAA
jgi:hypothetical protein